MSVHTVEGVARLSYEIVEQRGGAVGEGEGQWERGRAVGEGEGSGRGGGAVGGKERESS